MISEDRRDCPQAPKGLTEDRGSLRPFTVYVVDCRLLRTCYESEDWRVLCSLEGPLYERRGADLGVTASLHEATGSMPPTAVQMLCGQVEQVFREALLASAYRRASFQVRYDIVYCRALSGNAQGPAEVEWAFALEPLVNSLSFTSVLKGVELKAMVTCVAAGLRAGRVEPADASQPRRQPAPLADPPLRGEQDKLDARQAGSGWMVQCLEHRDGEAVFARWEGSFTTPRFEQLSGWLYDANLAVRVFLEAKVEEALALFAKRLGQ